MKKLLLNIFSLSILCFSAILVACTEEIDLDLNSSDTQIITEANISNLGVSVKLSETIPFDESNVFPLVENAKISISDDFGNEEMLTETEPGHYHSSTFFSVPENNYYLNIEVENNVLFSSSKVPKPVSLDFVGISTGNGFGGMGGGTDEELTNVIVKYQDPENEENQYRFIEFINNEYKGSYIFNDKLNNGLLVQNTLTDRTRTLNSGDTLRIEMQCIDKNVFKYFDSFGSAARGPIGSSSTPANPITNISGSRLGYFSAHTSESKTIIIF